MRERLHAQGCTRLSACWTAAAVGGHSRWEAHTHSSMGGHLAVPLVCAWCMEHGAIIQLIVLDVCCRSELPTLLLLSGFLLLRFISDPSSSLLLFSSGNLMFFTRSKLSQVKMFDRRHGNLWDLATKMQYDAISAVWSARRDPQSQKSST